MDLILQQLNLDVPIVYLPVTSLILFLVIWIFVKKSLLKKLALGALAIPILIGISVHVWLFAITVPSFFKTDFAIRCDQANGQEYTIANLSQIGGRCSDWWKHTSLTECTPEVIMEIIARNAKSNTNSFSIYEDGISYSWACTVYSTNDGKIKSISSYQTD